MDALVKFYPLLAALAGYLIGSLSFAVIVSRVMGLNDPRTYGSKNPGATNVLRSGSQSRGDSHVVAPMRWKGWLPVFLVYQFGKPYGLEEGTAALVGLAAFLGHLYPVFFRFVGGKGVATAVGVIFATSWILGVATLSTWLIIAFFFRYSSLASLVGAVFAPVYYIFGDGTAWYMDKYVLAAIVVMSGFLVWRHGENISRLIKGTESRLGAKKKA